MYVEGIIKASQVNTADEHAVWEMSGFIKGANTSRMRSTVITQKFGETWPTPSIGLDFGSSGSGTSQEWWWRLRVDGSSSASILWVAYLTCYVTDAP
jgi:hypothetical protein